MANIEGINRAQQMLVDAILADHPDRVNWLCKTKLGMPYQFSWITPDGKVKSVCLLVPPTVEQWRYIVTHLYDDHNYNVGSTTKFDDKTGKFKGPTGIGYLKYEPNLFHYHPVR